MPVAITANKGKIPYVNFQKDYFYIPVSLMPRQDITPETKMCFSMIVTEYLPLGLEYAQQKLTEVTINDIVSKYKQPLLMAIKIRDEITMLAPDLETILKGV